MKYLYSGAHFSPDRLHRYWLVRQMTTKPGIAVFVGLNPSTADETIDDPTIRRCIAFADEWGYGRMVMLNIHAYRSTDPRKLYEADDPMGPDNARTVMNLARGADLVVVAWGANRLDPRAQLLAVALSRLEGVKCLGLTKDGHPKHPLYLSRSTPLQDWPGLPKWQTDLMPPALPDATASP